MASFLFYLIIILAALGTGAVILAVRRTDRELKAVAQATCISCGAAFGSGAAKKAETDFQEACERVLDKNPEWLMNRTREWPVACSTCGTRHRYLPDEQKILAEEVDIKGQ